MPVFILAIILNSFCALFSSAIVSTLIHQHQVSRFWPLCILGAISTIANIYAVIWSLHRLERRGIRGGIYHE